MPGKKTVDKNKKIGENYPFMTKILQKTHNF